MATISPDRLDQQVRALEVTRQPETNITRMMHDLESASAAIRSIEPDDVEAFPAPVARLNSFIGSVEDAAESGFLTYNDSAVRDDFQASIRNLREEVGTFSFILRRGSDISADDFRELMRQRSRIIDGLGRIRDLIRYLRPD